MRKPDMVLTRRFERAEERRYVHLPFDIPAGVGQLHFRISYNDQISSDPMVGNGNTLDIGLFDEQGIASGGPGFRGWSGSERLAITIDDDWATPPYRPGPIGAGTWHVLLGPYKIGGRGLEARVEIWFAAGLPAEEMGSVSPIPVTQGDVPEAAEPGWVRGDLHCHTLYSDGDSWPAEVLAKAARIGLDFLAITDHNAAVIPTIPNGGDLPLLLPGIEVTTYRGHWNVWGLRQWFDFRDPTSAGVLKEMRRAIDAGGFVSINHPRPFGPDWQYQGIEINHAVEVWNGPWERLNAVCVAFWEAQLAEGLRPVALGGSDAHEHHGRGEGLLSPATLGEPTTWVFVGDELTEQSLLAGLRRGNCFVSRSPHGPQLYVARTGGDVEVRVAGGRGATLKMIGGLGEIGSRVVADNDWRMTVPVPEGAAYVRFVVVDDAGAMLAFGNPIWNP